MTSKVGVAQNFARAVAPRVAVYLAPPYSQSWIPLCFTVRNFLIESRLSSTTHKEYTSRSAKKRKSYVTRTILFAPEVYLFVDIREILIIHNLVFHAITPIAYLLFVRNSQNTTPNIHTVYVKKNGVKKIIVRGDILHSASHVQF